MSGIIKALGLVFGDIGTSPIYTVTVVFLLLEPTPDNILGVISLIFWTLAALIFIQYDWLAMTLSSRGEGGTIVLKEILVSMLHPPKKVAFITLLSFIGVSLLMGDGVITPAISILSAVEGSVLIPGLENLPKMSILLLSVIIAIGLFSFQARGTEKVAFSFGPIMLLWFSSLAIFGMISIYESMEIIKAVNPYYGIKFLSENGWKGYIALGGIFLCATGGEALYADMGHLGAKPIRKAWMGVFIALILNYMGQGAFLIRHPEAKNILFELVFYYAKPLYTLFLLLSIIATTIASQAMISGMFSVVYQAITTRIMPMFKVNYTSRERMSQIYIGTVNWFLLIAVVFIMLEFRESSKLASAYGLAVAGTMTVTGIIMTWIFYLRKNLFYIFLSLFVTIVDIIYLSANVYKIPTGGYWSLLIGIFPLLTILIYTQGQKRLYKKMNFVPLEDFLYRFKPAYETVSRVKGTALFLLRDITEIPPYVVQTMFYHGIIYDENIFLSIVKRSDPFGVTGFFKEDITKGLRVFEVQMGYMEMVDVEEILREAEIQERAVYHGAEEIISRNPLWRIFSFIKRNSPSLIQFYKFPYKKLHGVITRVAL